MPELICTGPGDCPVCKAILEWAGEPVIQHYCHRTDAHHHHEAQVGGYIYAENGPGWDCATPWASQPRCPGPSPYETSP